MLASPALALPYFQLEEGSKRCFVEEVPDDVLIVGKYRNLDWQMLKQSGIPGSILVQVRDPHQQIILEHETLENGQFAFTSSMSGDHEICVISTPGSNYGQTRSFRFELVLDFGEQARDYSQLAKAEHLSAIEVEVRKLNDKIKMIRGEQQFQKEREAEFRDTSEALNSAVQWWSIAQTVVLTSAGMIQLYLLTKFFKSKKLA